MDPTVTNVAGLPTTPRWTENDVALRRVSQDLEATFLSEMLKHAGVGKTPSSFGGGVGEDQFASLLRDLQAREVAMRGGIGLADSIFNSLKDRQNAR